MPTIDRRTTDTPRSYAALIDYAALGAGRSLETLAERYRSDTSTVPPTKRLTTLKDWSRSLDWQSRVADYDRQIQAEAELERGAIRTARRAELEEQDWATGSDLRKACEAMLLEMPRFLRTTSNEVKQDGETIRIITLALRAGPGELARALKLASEIQRLSVGVATEHIEHSGPGGGPIRTEVYEYDSAIAGIAARSSEDSDAPGQDTSAGDGPALGQEHDGRGD